jgi:hypothetical protein
MLKKADVVPEPKATVKKAGLTPQRDPEPPVRALPPTREVYVDGPVYGYGGPPMRPFGPRLGWGGGMQGGGMQGGGMMGRPMGGYGRRF